MHRDPAAWFLSLGFAASAFVAGNQLIGSVSPTAEASGPAWLKIASFVPIGIGGALVLIGPRSSPSRFTLVEKALSLYAATALVGALLNPSREAALMGWIEMATPLLAILAWRVRRGSSERILMAVLIAAALEVGYGLVLAAQGSGYSVNFSGQSRLGAGMSPVLFAFLAAAVVVWGVVSLSRSEGFRSVLGAVAIAGGSLSLYLARGRTGFIAALVMVIAALLMPSVRGSDRLERSGRRIVLVLAIVGIAIVSFSLVQVWFTRGESTRQIQSLTGRTDIWETNMVLIRHRPFVGWGPGHLGGTDDIGFALTGQVAVGRNAHNALLQATHDAGLIGASAWLVASLALFLSLLRTRDARRRALHIALWAGVVVFGLAEGAPAGYAFPWLLFLGLVAAAPTRAVLGESRRSVGP